jgi:Fe2+ or Zn2+ uptake regulation protein
MASDAQIHSDLDQRLVTELRERGMRVTSQRLVIHRAVCERGQHMTAEQVRHAVTEALPGTSLPTVYATLELLEELGLVRRLATGGGPVLFEARGKPHAHAICRRCGTTTDLAIDAEEDDALAVAGATGFVADHAQLLIWGLCERCAAQAAAA